MNLKQVLPLGFSIVFILVAISTIFSQISTDTLVNANEWVSHTYQVDSLLSNLEKTVINAESQQRGFLLTKNNQFLTAYNQSTSQVDSQFEEISKLISDNPEQLKRLSLVEGLIDKNFYNLQTIIDLRDRNQNQEMITVLNSEGNNTIRNQARSIIDEMIQVENTLLQKRNLAAQQAQKVVSFVNWGGCLAIIAVGVFTLLVINRIVVKPINTVVSAISNSSNQIAAMIEQQEKTATQQSISVGETTSIMNDLGAFSQQSTEQAEATALTAKDVLKLTQKETQAVYKSLTEMMALKDKVEKISEQITLLSTKTNQIGSISQLVSELSNQTNILALNAAVEAIRAGEYGKGFGVVATEIRKLADQSQKSAHNINALVEDIQQAIKSTNQVTQEGINSVAVSVKASQKTATAFSTVQDSVNKMVSNNQQISLNLQQQMQSVNQVMEAMKNINYSMKENTLVINLTRLNSEQLYQASRHLKAVI